MEVIHFYHINDLHSHFEKWPRISRFLQQKRREHESRYQQVFVFDIGDHMDRVHPYTEATLGKCNVDLLNEANVDFATIGNNEGITLPFEALDILYDNADFQVLIGNLFYPDYTRPKWVKPYHIQETKKGTKIGFIGLTVYFSKFYEELGWRISEPLEELSKIVSLMKEKADVLVLLSHLGIHEDEEIARRFPEIDVIMGGHTHHILEHGKIENKSLLACAGKHGNYIGHIQLVLDGHFIQSKTASLIDTNDIPWENQDEKAIECLQNKGEELLQQVVATLPRTLPSNWQKETELSRLLAEGLKEWCEADAAILNCGLFLKDLHKGPVTKLDIHQLLPHPINPCTIWIKGQELIEVMKQASEEKWMNWILKGLGFRGKVMGSFLFAGIHIVDEDSFHKKFWINGRPIEPEREYKVATIDMFTFGPFFPEIYRAEKKEYDVAHMLRDIMEWQLLRTFS
ncbi:MAG TPA: bifunctional UDP-sugar hydrolase/5'-nucleotidase [Bacillus sp. (in: firmicutes)]|uniref:bifunctional metallophosphatase/5'-nucleotidase n=1 Tax=Bacillus litorisediminis TaxID=2922713 RepID=UPI001FAF36F6|nr:bifunctional UDP-sugar hydrolase/5'-nucleotidase [Bacillus litorisediminis]HWO77159.1 bifunctional UDP-sugar hydrolase/5'-nucleotidase [Bacillus sp. (in: firmicutes)]